MRAGAPEGDPDARQHLPPLLPHHNDPPLRLRDRVPFPRQQPAAEASSGAGSSDGGSMRPPNEDSAAERQLRRSASRPSLHDRRQQPRPLQRKDRHFLFLFFLFPSNFLLVVVKAKVEESVTRSVATMSLAFVINSTPWIIKVQTTTIQRMHFRNHFISSFFFRLVQQIIVACLGNEVAPWLDFVITWSALSLGVWNPILCWLLCPPIREGVRHVLAKACVCCYSNNYSSPSAQRARNKSFSSSFLFCP